MTNRATTKKDLHKAARSYLGLYVSLFLLSFVAAILSFTYFYNDKHPESERTQEIERVNKAKTIHDTCNSPTKNKRNSVANCYAQALYKLAKEKGYDYTFEVFKKIQNNDKEAQVCHFIAHQIGRGVYHHDANNWRDVFNRASAMCGSGILHGLAEEYLASLPKDTYFLPETLRGICVDYSPLSCHHTVGHVLYLKNEGAIDSSIKQCNIFLKQDEKSSCYKGVFMENISPTMLIAHGLAPESMLNQSARMPSFLSLCQKYNTDKAVYSQCWEQLAEPFLALNELNLNKSLSLCNDASDSEASLQCKKRAVYLLAVKKPLDIGIMKDMCRVKDFFDLSVCYKEIVTGAVENVNISSSSVIINFCLSVDESFRASCFRQIGAVMKGRISDKDIKQICQTAPEDYQKYCLK